MTGRPRDNLRSAAWEWFDTLLDQQDRSELFGYSDGSVRGYGNHYLGG